MHNQAAAWLRSNGFFFCCGHMKAHRQFIDDCAVSILCHDRYLFLAAGQGERRGEGVESAAF